MAFSVAQCLHMRIAHARFPSDTPHCPMVTSKSVCRMAVHDSGSGPIHKWSPRAHLHVVGMLRFMSDINQPNLPTPFYSVLVSISLFMALSTVFHSINSPRQLSTFSLCFSGLVSALLVLSTICLFMKVSLYPDIILCVWLGLKHQLTN